jgi:AcrR family transcriptional regulator
MAADGTVLDGAAPARPEGTGYAAGRATRELLITTAQRLFAERGIDAVSLREVASAAGTRNTAAAQYYFGNKEELLLAIFRQHSGQIADRRLALLERVTDSDDPVRAIAEAVIVPLADQVGVDGFLSFLARCQSDHVRSEGVLGTDVSGTYVRARELLRAQLPELPEAVFQRRFELATKVVVTALADVEWRERSGRRTRESLADVVPELVDLVSAMVLAPSPRKEFP